MKFEMYVVDAFASKTFQGNPAAVVLLDNWLPAELMQRIAGENNLSRTAFIRSTFQGQHIRWFTPAAEVPFCGDATLAAAHVLRSERGVPMPLSFSAGIGTLIVTRQDEQYELHMPTVGYNSYRGPLPNGLPTVLDAFASFENVFVRLARERDVRNYIPELDAIRALHPLGFAITASGDDVDFVSRYFAPGYGIPEDPLTGSIHATLVPYWGTQLSKTRLIAKQLSTRGAKLECALRGDRVVLRGSAVTYLRGLIDVPPVHAAFPEPPYLRMR